MITIHGGPLSVHTRKAIVKADGKGGFKIVARIASDEWSRLPH